MTKIILDTCCNHLGNREILDKMISYPPSNMVNFIKFQLFNTEKLNKNYPNYEEYKSKLSGYQIDKETLEHIFKEFNWAVEKKPMFTIFSEDRLEFLQSVLDSLDYSNTWPVDFALKIASPDMSNYKLIDAVRRTFPDNLLIISTGMHIGDEISACMYKYQHEVNVKFLHCVSEYPTHPKDIDWAKVRDMDGFSDHTIGIEAARQCLDMGVEFLEFHFTLSKNLPGKDHSISKDIDELNRIVSYKQTLMNNKNYKARWNG